MSATVSTPTRAALDGVPHVDVAGSLRTAIMSGGRIGTIIREAVALRRGPGQLTMAEYCYYRMWESRLSLAEKRRFVGKRVQQAMHLACNDYGWNAATEDKLLFHGIAPSAGLPVPELLAIAHPTRRAGGVPSLASVETAESLLHDPKLYPFFAKPIDGMYSLGAVSADRVDTRGTVYLADGTTKGAQEIAASLVNDHARGALIQRRLAPTPGIAKWFGNRLWSVRLLALLGEDGVHVARALCKIPAPRNVADNFWRPGNMVAAVELETGRLGRVIRGTGAGMETDFDHPETGTSIVGFEVPDWTAVRDLVARAAPLFPGVRTQSWDVALTDQGPVILEVNWGGDLNLAQLAYGAGVLDDRFAAHLAACGYERRRALRRVASLSDGLRGG